MTAEGKLGLLAVFGCTNLPEWHRQPSPSPPPLRVVCSLSGTDAFRGLQCNKALRDGKPGRTNFADSAPLVLLLLGSRSAVWAVNS